MSKAEDVFKAKAPKIMDRLVADLKITVEEAAAIMGNAGHESLGLTVMQEIKPTVPGSRGGYGWFQWTGPRRRDFEAFCKDKHLDISSDEANYQFLIHELRTTEGRAIPALKKATGLRNKVVAFEDAFERAGVKAYDARVRWASMALLAHGDKPAAPVQPLPPTPVPPMPEPVPPAPVPPAPAPGATIAKWVMGVIVTLFAALAAWMMKG